MKNQKLKIFNSIRKIAQTIDNELFKKEYQNIMLPLLEKFKMYKEEADNSIVITDELNKFINSMHQKAITFQYVPFNRKRNDSEIYKNHNKLYELEILCKELLNN